MARRAVGSVMVPTLAACRLLVEGISGGFGSVAGKIRPRAVRNCWFTSMRRPRIVRARPWVWASSSTGRALPRVGRATDVELRFSSYR